MSGAGIIRPFRISAVAFAIVLAASLGISMAQDAVQVDKGDAIAPVEKYSEQIGQLKKDFDALGGKIDETAKTMDGLTDVKTAKAQIAEIKDAVGKLLAAVSDNGEVAQLGRRAEQRIAGKLKALQSENRFTADQRKFLADQWQKLQARTHDAGRDLADARKEFAGLLQQLQNNEDFIDELVQVRQAEKAVEVLRQLTADIRNASSKLKALLNGIKAPTT